MAICMRALLQIAWLLSARRSCMALPAYECRSQLTEPSSSLTYLLVANTAIASAEVSDAFAEPPSWSYAFARRMIRRTDTTAQTCHNEFLKLSYLALRTGKISDLL